VTEPDISSDLRRRLARHLPLEQLAHLAVRIGVNIQPGQPLVVSGPVAATELTEEIARSAYRLGSGPVQCVYDNPALLQMALTDMLPDHLPRVENPLDWADEAALRMDAARLHIWGPEPALLEGIAVDRIVRLHAVFEERSKQVPACERGSASSALPFVTEAWARTVYPCLKKEEAVAALWESVIALCCADAPNPEAQLRARLATICRLTNRLQSLPLSALHFRDEETDLLIGLRPFPVWQNGINETNTSVPFLSEFPPGPVYTTPDPARTEGHLSVNRPVAVAGDVVRGLKLRFSDGGLSAFEACSGREAFERLINLDDGAWRLGRVGLALPPAGMRCNVDGFLAPVVDRASAMHVTLGAPEELSPNAGYASKANRSAVGIDLMFSTPTLEVDGVLENGQRVELFRAGGFLNN